MAGKQMEDRRRVLSENKAFVLRPKRPFNNEIIFRLKELIGKMEEDVISAKEEGIKIVAKNLLAKNTNLEFIAEVTGLSNDKIKKLQTENDDKVH